MHKHAGNAAPNGEAALPHGNLLQPTLERTPGCLTDA